VQPEPELYPGIGALGEAAVPFCTKEEGKMASLRRQLSKRLPFTGVFLTLLVVVPLIYAAEAPTGFDNLTNGFENQTHFDVDRGQFETLEQLADGLGPVYNAQGCSECHQNPVSGSSSQINELRAGQTQGGVFFEHVGGSLVQDRAIHRDFQEKVLDTDDTRTFRVSLNILGDGFVEALPDSEFTRIQNLQPNGMKGTTIPVPVLEALSTNGTPVTRIGRFGWKDQHASLLSFAADAYLNEIGITSPLFPTDNTSDGNVVDDGVSDPEDPMVIGHPFGKDVESFAMFMRSTKAPPRGPITQDVIDGEVIFKNIGCENCHSHLLTTAPENTSFANGSFVVDSHLGSKDIHPYGDFMLHNIGTGDGIVQNGGADSRNMIRTAPLWGLHMRNRMLHDGSATTVKDAITRHHGQAEPTVTGTNGFNSLSGNDKAKLFAFLDSL
jgi:CxxC motif-containing protein (DUF1111 family)